MFAAEEIALTMDSLLMGLAAKFGFGIVTIFLIFGAVLIGDAITPRLDLQEELKKGNWVVGLAVVGVVFAIAAAVIFS